MEPSEFGGHDETLSVADYEVASVTWEAYFKAVMMARQAGHEGERTAVRPAASPPTRPEAWPQAVPAARSRARNSRRRAAWRAARLGGDPGALSAQKAAAGRGRQVAAMRFAVIATSALFLVAVATGATEICLHGFAFFVFRSAGTGETGANGPQEDQGPGQQDAPRPALSHLTVQPSPHAAVTVHQG